MQNVQPVRAPALNREHLIRGIWKTRRLSIDGQEITMDMVKGRLRKDGWYPSGDFGDVQAFTWGATATPRELQVLAYGCCEFARLEPWSQHITSRFALEQLFTAHLQQLPSADFALHYRDHELRAAMRRFKRGGKAPYWWSRMSIFLAHIGNESTWYSRQPRPRHAAYGDGTG
jgi:hypothetical protein